MEIGGPISLELEDRLADLYAKIERERKSQQAEIERNRKRRKELKSILEDAKSTIKVAAKAKAKKYAPALLNKAKGYWKESIGLYNANRNLKKALKLAKASIDNANDAKFKAQAEYKKQVVAKKKKEALRKILDAAKALKKKKK